MLSEISLAIQYPESIGHARREAQTMANHLGFDAVAREEITLSIMELASNLIKHAGQGMLHLIPLEQEGHVGLQIEAIDQVPGIPDVHQATTDGFSSVGSLGIGLGTINRLMDEFNIESHLGRGTHILCRKWLRAPNNNLNTSPLEWGIATRPRQRSDVNGDAFVAKAWAEFVLVGVIDGLGHGPFAHRAAESARHYIEAHYDQPLERIFQGTELACRATRGVVMALALFDWKKSVFQLASVGNIEVRLFPPAPFSYIVRRGIVGLNAPHPRVTQHNWASNNQMLLFSDGIKTHWTWDDFPGLANKNITAAAQELL
jgi:anti-sigma regulatory factor (Ser/Thr protein kinase)